MKFTVAWAKIVSENHALKFVILCLSLTTATFGFASLKLALRDPLVIERSCLTKAATIQDGKRTQTEVEGFLGQALSQRFDTDANVHDGILSDEEAALREKEQKELAARKLSQRIVLNKVVFKDGGHTFKIADLITAPSLLHRISRRSQPWQCRSPQVVRRF